MSTAAEARPEVPKPSQTPAARLIDDFERAVDAWAAFRDEAKDTRLAFDRDPQIKHGGAASLRVRYDLAPESWATCSLVYDQPRNWSGFQGLSLYLHAEKEGQPVTIVAYGGTSPDDLLLFEYRLKAGPSAVKGWQQIDVRWEQLKPAPWQGDGTGKFDPRSAMGVAFAFEPSEGDRNLDQLWIDDIPLR